MPHHQRPLWETVEELKLRAPLPFEDIKHDKNLVPHTIQCPPWGIACVDNSSLGVEDKSREGRACLGWYQIWLKDPVDLLFQFFIQEGFGIARAFKEVESSRCEKGNSLRKAVLANKAALWIGAVGVSLEH